MNQDMAAQMIHDVIEPANGVLQVAAIRPIPGANSLTVMPARFRSTSQLPGRVGAGEG